MRDGVVTEDEVVDLVGVAELLCVDKGEALELIEEARRAAGLGEGGATGGAGRCERFRLRPGDLVVFTGDMSRPREEWIRRAATAGLVPHPQVTKSVALVVAADPDSLSGKAKKAAGYGIPIVGECAFEQMLQRL